MVDCLASWTNRREVKWKKKGRHNMSTKIIFEDAYNGKTAKLQLRENSSSRLVLAKVESLELFRSVLTLVDLFDQTAGFSNGMLYAVCVL